jgi:hypothetical protein
MKRFLPYLIWGLIFPAIITGALIALQHLGSASIPPPSPVVFVRYLNEIHYPDGSHDALFVITNNTAQWLDTYDALAKIQTKTTFGWTDFTSKSPDGFISLGGSIGIEPHGIYTIESHVPQNQRPWRLHVHYTIRGVKDYDVYSQKMPSEPAR